MSWHSKSLLTRYESPRRVRRLDVYRNLCYLTNTQGAIEKSFTFSRRHLSAIFIEPPVVKPVQICRGFCLDVIRIPPRPPRLDQLRLEQSIDRFGQRIIMRIANRPDGRINPNLEEA